DRRGRGGPPEHRPACPEREGTPGLDRPVEEVAEGRRALASQVRAEFRGFLLKSNALALAIGVIIGGALGTVVNSLVNDIIIPPVGLGLGGGDVSAHDMRL